MVLITVLRAIHIAATVLVTGAFAFDLLILRSAGRPRPDPALSQPVHRWLRQLCIVGLAAGLISWAAWLGTLAISMSGLPPSEALRPDILRKVVALTTFGHVWLVRLGLFVVLGIYLLHPQSLHADESLVDKALGATASVVLAGSLAWTGHALGTHPGHLLADSIHLIAAALWLGMLPPLWFSLRRAAREDEPVWLLFAGEAAKRFSAPGMMAVACLAATGVANAWYLVDSPHDLVTTRYGFLLLAKIALFALMLGVAAVNKTRLTPRLIEFDQNKAERTVALRRLLRNVLAENLIGAAILVLVGSLGVTAPATHEHAMHQMQDM